VLFVDQVAEVVDQLGLDLLDQLLGEAFEQDGDREFRRLAVADDHDVRRHRLFAVGVGVELRDDLVGVDAARQVQFDAHGLAGAVVDGGDLDLALFDRGFDRRHQRFGGGAEGDLGDRELLFTVAFDFRTQTDLAEAIGVIRRVHQPALGEIGQDGEGLVLEDLDLGLQ